MQSETTEIMDRELYKREWSYKIALKDGDIKTVCELFQQGAIRIDSQFKTFQNDTPLHIAVSNFKNDNRVLVDMLLEVEGIAVNKPNTLGQTPIISAAYGGNEIAIKKLILNGADYRVIDPQQRADIIIILRAFGRDRADERIAAWIKEWEENPEAVRNREEAEEARFRQYQPPRPNLVMPTVSPPVFSIPKPSTAQQLFKGIMTIPKMFASKFCGSPDEPSLNTLDEKATGQVAKKML